MSPDEKDTHAGYIRRTGPATAEILDKNTGKVYRLNTAVLADFDGPGLMWDGREWMDHLFSDEDSA